MHTLTLFFLTYLNSIKVNSPSKIEGKFAIFGNN